MALQEVSKFHWADYLVFGLSLAFCIGIGVFHTFFGKPKTATEQFVGSRNMKVLPVALSCIMGSLAPPFFIGIPIETYCFGVMYSVFLVALLLIIPLTSLGYLPPMHRLKIISSYQYLEKRFGKIVKAMSSALYVLMMVFYIGVVIYTPARSFTQVMGISIDIIIGILCVVCIFYTALGGIKAVVWADVFQSSVIVVGLLVLLVKGSVDAGGPKRIVDVAIEGGRLDVSAISPDPTVRHTWWTQIIGGISFGLATTVGNQAIVQRALSISTLRRTQIAVVIFGFGTIFCLLIVTGIGLILFAFYYECDPITSNAVSATYQVMPMFMMDVLGDLHGIPGLFTAGIFAATLSTMAAGVNALAAVLYTDIIVPLYIYKYEEDIKERPGAIITKAIAVVMGLLTMGLAYAAPYLGPTLMQVVNSLFGIVGGPLMGLFTAAIFIPCVNKWGALAGLVVSLAVSFWVAIGAIVHPNPPALLPMRTDGCPVDNSTFSTATPSGGPFRDSEVSGSSVTDFYKISYMWYGPLAIAITCLVGVIVSLMTGGHKESVDPDLVFNYEACCCRSFFKSCCPVESTVLEPEKELDQFGEKYFVPHAEKGYTNSAFKDDKDISLKL